MHVIPVLGWGGGGWGRRFMNSKSVWALQMMLGVVEHAFSPCTWGAELLSLKLSGLQSKFQVSQDKGKGCVRELRWRTDIKFNPFGLKHMFNDTIKTSKTDFIKQNRKYCYMTRIPCLRKPAILFTYFIGVFSPKNTANSPTHTITYSSSLNLKKPAIVFLLQDSL